jgi:hypothetical protein
MRSHHPTGAQGDNVRNGSFSTELPVRRVVRGLARPTGTFVDEARPKAQTGDRRHSHTDGVAGAAWPWSKSSQFGSGAGWPP